MLDLYAPFHLIMIVPMMAFFISSTLASIYQSLIFVLQRPESVKIDAYDVSGTRFSVSLSDLPARVFQHEFDHLEVCFSTSTTYSIANSEC